MKILLLVCLSCFFTQSFGQATSLIDRKDLKSFVKILTSDSLEGRGTGSVGQKRAANFISSRFKVLGLLPHDPNGYFEKFKLIQTYWGQVYVKTPKKTLMNFENMVFQGSNTQNDEAVKEVIFGGHGTVEELNQIEVKDRFVLVFVNNLRGNYDVNTRLRKRGAYGMIIANPENENQFESIKKTYKDYALQKRSSFPGRDTLRRNLGWDTIRFLNTITIPNSEIKNVMGRTPKELNRAIEEKKIGEIPFTSLKFKFEKIQQEIETENIIGILKGKSDKTIVISAHYDHLGKSGAEYFPGADDNASGTAALLELAEAYSHSNDLEYSLLFLATSAEEAGLLGSYFHVQQPGFDPKKILCDLNLDMIAGNDGKHKNNKYLYCLGMGQSSALDDLIKKADQLYESCTLDYSLSNIWDPSGLFTRSDNYNFYKKGIPAFQFFSGLHSDYHQITDTADKIDFDNFESRIRLISQVIELLQKDGLRN